MRLSDHYQYNAFTRHLIQKRRSLPVVWRRSFSDPARFAVQKENGECFQYCNAEGQIIDEFPVNQMAQSITLRRFPTKPVM